jgi:hypothetical protein
MEAGEFLARAKQRLSGAGFRVEENVGADGHNFDLVASRKRFELSKFGAAQNFFVFSTLSSVDSAQMREFSSACFRYVTNAQGSAVPRGMGRAVYCYAVAVVPQVDAATSKAVRTQAPGRHWAASEIPVVAELNTGKLHYFEKTPLWGAAYYRGFRRTIRQLLGP